MEFSFIHRTDAHILCLFLFIGMLVMVGLGRRTAAFLKQEKTEGKGGVDFLLSALFGLSAFILAFTFGMSASRYTIVRDTIVAETNDIGTALLRSDLYPDSVRDGFRQEFKKYIDARVAYYHNVKDTTLFFKAEADAAIAEQALWARAMRQSKGPNMLIPSNQMVPALNKMFDTASTIERILYSRVPDLIVYMLFILALVTSFIGGFTSSGIRKRDWIVIVVFASISSMVTYITLDLGRPMRGIIKANVGEQAIIDLQKKLQ